MISVNGSGWKGDAHLAFLEDRNCVFKEYMGYCVF